MKNSSNLLLIGLLLFLFNAGTAQFVEQYFENTADISIPDNAPATTYPSIITVAGMPNHLSYINVYIDDLFHLFGTSEFDILLESPDGQRISILSDVPNHSSNSNGYDLLFLDMDATRTISNDNYTNQTNNYLPTNIGLTDEFPVLGSITNDPSFLTLQNINPNGDWKLYIADDSFDGVGGSLSGWALNIESSPALICQRPENVLDLIAVDRNEIEVNWNNIDGDSWDIFYSAIDEVLDYSSLPTVENISGNNYLLQNLDYDTEYNIYYRIDCSGNNQEVSRWVGPIMATTETGICAYAEDVNFCQTAFYEGDYYDAFFDPCTGGSTFVNQSMFNFKPPQNGDYYLSSTSNGTNLFSLSIRPQDAAVDYCDSLNWRCVPIVQGLDHPINNLSSDTTYKLLVFSNASFEFRMGFCPLPRNIKLKDYTPHANDVDFYLTDLDDNALIGNFDLYYAANPSVVPGLSTTPSLTNINLTDGRVSTIPQSLEANTNYDLYLREICGTGSSCWVGPFDFKTDEDCGEFMIDSISLRTTATTAWIQYPDLAFNGMSVIYRDTSFTQPDYDVTGNYDLVTNGSTQNPFIPGVFIYQLEANTTYYYYLKNTCSGQDFNSQSWQGPFTFQTNSESFVEPKDLYCGQCYTVESRNRVDERIPNANVGNRDLFPNLDPQICTFETFDPKLEEVFIYQANETTTIELSHILFGSCGGGDLTEFLVQYYIKSASLPVDFNNWNYLGCIYLEGASDPQNVYDDIFFDVEKDSSYYILADVYGNICNASISPSTRFEVKGDCTNPCANVENLTATENNGFSTIDWDEVPGALGYEIRTTIGSATNLPACSPQFVILEQSNTHLINLDSAIAVYPPNTPISFYVRVHCGPENYSSWEEVSLTPAIGSQSVFDSRSTLGFCGPTYNRTTLSPISDVPYDILPFTVNATGTYYFDTRASSSSSGTYVAIYQNSFDIDNPDQNIVFETENASNQSLEFSVELNLGINYIFTISPIDIPPIPLSIFLEINGPGFINADNYVYRNIEDEPHGQVPATDGMIYQSNRYCLDKDGWRHYYYSHPTNPGGEDYLILSVENYDELINHLPTNIAKLGGAMGTSLITNPPADYVTVPGGWHTMNRHWAFNIPDDKQPTVPTTIRFYYSEDDLIALRNASGVDTLDHMDLNFNKINGPFNNFDINPVNGHAGIPAATNCAADGIWEYFNGNVADTINWSLGNYQGDFYAELKVHSFSGGGGGAGSFRASLDVDNDGFDYFEDCDDNNPDINPDVDEIAYDGLDNDCNELTLEDDLDEDGFVLAEDCDDNNPDINPDVDEIAYDGLDNDCNELTLDDDLDEDGFVLAEDCDDNNSNVNPNVDEIVYDGLDNDCNELTLDDDLDEDGFVLAEDCDDNNPDVNPDIDEIFYDGLDNDCNELTLDDDLDGDGFVLAEDCDDNNPDINPNVDEIAYDGLDNDCNELTLDDDLDEDGFVFAEDCDDNNPDVNPNVDEIAYDGLDNDCNELTLDDDLDGDGFVLTEDCDDTNENVNPNGVEIPNNGIDEDCDGSDLITLIQELAEGKIKIYPNPVGDQLMIVQSAERYLNCKISLFNIIGNLLEESTLNSAQLIINMEKFENGIYLLEIEDLQSGERMIEKVEKIK